MAKHRPIRSHGLDGETYPLLFESVDNMVCTLDLDGRVTAVNRAGERLTGYTRDELVGRSALDLIPADLRAHAARRFRARLTDDGERAPDEFVLVARDGRQIPIEITSTIVVRNGQPEGVLGIVRDLTERKRAEEALRQSEQRFHDAFESAAIGMALVAPDGRFLEVNASLCDIVGYPAEELLACTFQDITHPDDLEADLDYVRQMLAGEIRSYQMEKRYFHRDGETVWVLLSVSLVRDGTGEPVYFVSQIEDISERKHARQALERSEKLLAEAQRIARVGSWERDLRTGAGSWSEELYRIYGLDPATDEPTPGRYLESVHPDDRGALEDAVAKAVETGDPFALEYRIVPAEGTTRWIHVRGSCVVEDGRVVGLRGTAQDVTERKEAERRYRTLVEQLPIGMYIRPLDLSEPNIYASPQVEPLLGYPAEAWETDPGLLARIVHPDDRERVLAEAERVRSTGEPVRDEYRYLTADGRTVWVQDETYVVCDENGRPAFVQGFLLDITERKQAEADRDRLGEELHRAQKLEALGRLAGGIAHDFNNMLTAIRGYSELLLDRLEPGSEAHDEAAEIRRAAEQAAGLPQQLLAFGRRQSLEPKLVDLNAVVATTTGLLRHLLTEAIDLVAVPGAAAATTFVDPGQIEHALVNLALNARDAMPGGGTLTIATRNADLDAALAAKHDAEPGAYIVLSVSDTGAGMDEETRARVFEPFFTTKPQGEGTGLGLASVYGTVTQSGGFVRLDTEPGAGTTVELYLRCAAPVPATSTNGHKPERHRLPTVIVAEDEDIVRRLAADVLSRAGFRVLTAADGAEALRLHEHLDGPLDALVTDVVMPGVGGRELAERIRTVDPSLPIVFMSGYAGQAGHADLGSGDRTAFLQKPFSPRTLVDAVRRAVGELDTPSARTNGHAFTCVVADDHPTVLDSVSRFLESKQIDVVRAQNGAEALEKVAGTRPAVALLDVAMKPFGGVEAARRILSSGSPTRVVLFTGHRDPALLEEALAAGARGFVLKESLAELEEAVRTVAKGGTYVDARVRAGNGTSVRLTPREQEVLGLVADGMTNDKVAAQLSISPETVQSHIRKAMEKLDAGTRTEAVATALRKSLIH